MFHNVQVLSYIYIYIYIYYIFFLIFIFIYLYFYIFIFIEREIYKRHIPKLTQKNGLFLNREQPNLFIQQYSLNIMDMLRHKSFGCSDVYDNNFLRRDESRGLGGESGQNLDESGGFWAINRQNLNFLLS